MLRPKKLGKIGVSLALTACSGLLSGVASAGVVVHKPAPHVNLNGAECGSAVARAGAFTVLGTEADHVPISGEATPFWPSQYQGMVYLMRGTNATPERVYQFPGVANAKLQAGAEVAISNRFLAFTTRTATGGQALYQDSVLIARNVNGTWAECPLVGGQRDCNGAVRENGDTANRALTRIPLTYPISGTAKDVGLALSDDNLIISYKLHSRVEFYRYDTSTDRWNLENTLTEPVERYTGTSVAIEGDLVAVGVPWSKDGVPGVELGSVRLYRRNASTRTWVVAGAAYGYFTAGTFGNRVALSAGNLVVRAGGPYRVGGSAGVAETLAFYRVGSDGSLSAAQQLAVSRPHVNLALSGDTLASTVWNDPEQKLAIYKRDGATGQWRYESGLAAPFYQARQLAANGPAYSGEDPIALSGDDLSLGWRTLSSTSSAIFLGGAILDKASLLDTCRTPSNLVTNCSFDNGTNTVLDAYPSGNGWQLLSYNGASAWADYSGRQLRINISSAGSDMWHIQARTAVNVATAGTYTLKFRVKADSARSFVVNLGRNGSSDNQWTSYGRVTGTATTQWTTFTFTLPSIPRDPAAYLDLNVGNAGTSAITFDGIKLTAN